MSERPPAQSKVPVRIYDGAHLKERRDTVVTEEPLEIRVSSAGSSETLAVTMRTPGSDFELAVGFLFGEGIVTSRDQVLGISYCRDDDLPPDQLYNIVIVELAAGADVDMTRLERHFHMSSACGVCGKATIESLSLRGVKPVAHGPTVPPSVVTSLPAKLREAQKIFASTGGLHAAALFDAVGEVIAVREDVGRHNAFDKLVGSALLDGGLPLGEHIVMVSGRSSFEIAQKAASAGIRIVCSVSAPSSLAIDVAKEFGITLIGFLRDERFNVYSGFERLSP